MSQHIDFVNWIVFFRLFNLFCLYGDVGPIKFLRSKEGAAMVELHSAVNANVALANLSMISFCGNQLSVSECLKQCIYPTGHYSGK